MTAIINEYEMLLPELEAGLVSLLAQGKTKTEAARAHGITTNRATTLLRHVTGRFPGHTLEQIIAIMSGQKKPTPAFNESFGVIVAAILEGREPQCRNRAKVRGALLWFADKRNFHLSAKGMVPRRFSEALPALIGARMLRNNHGGYVITTRGQKQAQRVCENAS